MEHEDVLIVDVDQTLIKTDLLWESILLLLKGHILVLFMLPFWLIKGGRALLKTKIADIVTLDVSVLPYNRELIDFLTEFKSKGKELLLASASDKRIVDQISKHLGLFSESFGTTSGCNLKGKKKLNVIQAYCKGRSFSYIGNDKADLPIWALSKKAYVVTGSRTLLRRIKRDQEDVVVFPRSFKYRSLTDALRVYQWSKNILLFIPLLLAHQILNSSKFISCAIAFFAFNLCASSFYILNDFMDLDADRKHYKKKYRPFASGVLSIESGVILFLVCLISSLIISVLYFNYQFLMIVLLYCVSTLLYSLVFKKKMVIDVIILSSFYALRIFAGGVAADVPVSEWLLAFSMFFFLSLAFLKRYIELNTSEQLKKNIKGRNYTFGDKLIVQSSGISSGFMSVLVFCLYIANSKEVRELYTQPKILWFAGPVLIYWILRMWMLAQRGIIDSDPVFYATKDRVSLLTGLVVIFIVIMANRI
jgi:4-hydroxybenzoate polyprenyltransferase